MTGPPSDPIEAAAWLRDKYDWLDDLITTVTDPILGTESPAQWLSELAIGFRDIQDQKHAWDQYESVHPEPYGQGDEAWGRWNQAGPGHRTKIGHAIVHLPLRDRLVLQLVVSLAIEECATVWRVSSMRRLTDREVPLLEDWITIVRSQVHHSGG
ncbi:hypothetical protein ACQBAU_17130 [Propionibacteriaceae bacterium Y2011]